MRSKKVNYWIYLAVIIVFGILIYVALDSGKNFENYTGAETKDTNATSFQVFQSIIGQNIGHQLSILLFQLIAVLFTVRVFSYLFKQIGQPSVIGEIFAGLLVGPSFLGYFFPDLFNYLFPEDSLNYLYLFSEIGLVLFMFVIGMELDFGQLKNRLHKTLVISHVGILAPLVLGILVSVWVYDKYTHEDTPFIPFALFVGISMSITAITVLSRIIQEKNLTGTSMGTLSLASAANDDVTAWCILAVAIALTKAGSFTSALFTIGAAFLYIIFMFLVVRPILKKAGEKHAREELITKPFIAIIFLIVLSSAAITEVIGIHALFGAFMAGVVMPPNHGFRKVMMEKIEDVATIFFLPLFFALTGLRTDIWIINTPGLWGVCLLFVSVAVVGKLGGCTLAARAVGEPWKNSWIIGTLMNTRGLIELIALNLGFQLGVLPQPIFVILVIMAFITTLMTMPILSLIDKVYAAKERKLNIKQKIILLIRSSMSGKYLMDMANILLGNRLKHTAIVAVHYTVGTDVNPARAQEYNEENFSILDKEAKALNLNIRKEYKVTDTLIQDIDDFVVNEDPDMVFMGADQNFMLNRNFLDEDSSLSRILKRFRKETTIKKNQLKGKIKSIIERIDRMVVIFVNRGYEEAKKIYILLDDDNDRFLLSFARTRINEPSLPLHVSLIDQTSIFSNEVLSRLVTTNPEKFIMDEPLVNNPFIFDKDNLLILSLDTCEKLAQDAQLFAQLPSMLVIRPKLYNEK